jgi:hypothetical protein
MWLKNPEFHDIGNVLVFLIGPHLQDHMIYICVEDHITHCS